MEYWEDGEANRIYQALTRASTLKEERFSPNSGNPCPFSVPSTVKSTLKSPVRFQNHRVFTCANTGRLRWQLVPFLTHLRLFRSAWWDNVALLSPMFIGSSFFVCWHSSGRLRRGKLVLANSFGCTALSAFCANTIKNINTLDKSKKGSPKFDLRSDYSWSHIKLWLHPPQATLRNIVHGAYLSITLDSSMVNA